MEFQLRYETILSMLQLVEDTKEGNYDTCFLAEILDSPDYEMEFQRYGSRVNKREFTEYFRKCSGLLEETIENAALKAHHVQWMHVFENTAHYKYALGEWKKIFCPSLFETACQEAKRGLPSDIEIGRLNIVFTLGIGPSFEYPYKNCIHFDFIRLDEEYKGETGRADFLKVIAHEIHHIGFDKVCQGIDEERLSDEAYFCLSLAGEGLAVKFVNNCGGILTKQLHPGEGTSLDEFSIRYLNDDFEDTFAHFKDTICRIRDGRLAGRAAVDQEIHSYWLNTHTCDQAPTDIPKLKQSRMYTFGCELWGSIYDAFGLETLYDVVKNPDLCVEYFTKAVKQMGRESYAIEL